MRNLREKIAELERELMCSSPSRAGKLTSKIIKLKKILFK